METGHLDADDCPLRAGLYEERKVVRKHFFIDPKSDYYEVIDPITASVQRSGRISNRAKNYFRNARPIDIQSFIDYHQHHIDFFEARKKLMD